MSAGSNVKVIGSGWFRHNSSGSVTCIAVAPGWLVMYLHFEGFHAIPKAYMIIAAASILDLRPSLDAASKSPSSTKYCCHSSICLWGHVLGHCACVHVVCFPVRPRHAGHRLQCGSLQFLFGSFLQFLHCSTCRHGPVIIYGSHLHVVSVFFLGRPGGLFCGAFPSSGW